MVKKYFLYLVLISFLFVTIIFNLSNIIALAAQSNPVNNELSSALDFGLKILPYLSLFAGLYAWWDTAKNKKYAAEEDFKRIKERLESITQDQRLITELVKQHEQKTFTNFTAQTNQIFSELKEIQNDAEIIKQLINNIQMIITPNINSGFRND